MRPVEKAVKAGRPDQGRPDPGTGVEPAASSKPPGSSLMLAAKPAVSGKIARALEAYQQQIDFSQQNSNIAGVGEIDFYV